MRAILTYHSIDPSGSPVSVHPDAFARHLAWLASGSVKVMPLEALIAAPDAADAVAVTFDDGMENLREALPRLVERKLPATVFVVSDRTGGYNDWGGKRVAGIPHLRLLDWSELRRWQAQGISIGAHSRTHADLTTLPPAALDEEVRGSADIIQREIGVRPRSFAYPYGAVNDAVARAVSAHFAYACTTELQPLHDDADPMRLPRLDMYYMQAPGRLERFGTPAFKAYVSVRRQLRRVRQAWPARRAQTTGYAHA
jgi:peptidoglycan/xylan/chitin deacetylase (PgdA/CDA1 family)